MIASGAMVAGAIPVMLTVDGGEGINLDRYLVRDNTTDKVQTYRMESYQGDGFTIQSLVVKVNPDPMISYGISIQDLGAASTFSFSMASPIVADKYNHVTASLAGSVTDGDPNPANASVTFTPAFGPLAQVAEDHVAGDGWVNDLVDIGGAAAWPVPLPLTFGSGTYPTVGAANNLVGGKVYDAMRVTLSFTGSGGDDIYTFNGRVDKTTVPDGGSMLVLLGSALSALAFVGRRMK